MKIKILGVFVLFSLFSFSQTELEAGDLAIIGLDTGNEDFMFVTFKDLETGTTIYFTDEEASGDYSIGTGEGTLLFETTTTIAAGTVISRLEHPGLFSITSDGNLSLGNSGDGLIAYQGPSVGVVTTFLHAIGKDESHLGTFPDGFSNYILTGSDDATYAGNRTGNSIVAFWDLINTIAFWETSGSGVTFDTTPFTFQASTEPTTTCGLESFENSNAVASYTSNLFTGNDGVIWSFRQSRNANNDANNSGIDLPALMLRGSSYESELQSSMIPNGIQDFSVTLYKGFTGSGNRQVELLVNGVSYGFSEPFNDYEAHVFSVSNINVAGNVSIAIRAATNSQVIVDDISWTCYTAAQPQIEVAGNETPILPNSTDVSIANGTDLGEVNVGGVGTQTFEITNVGAEPLLLSAVLLATAPSDFSITVPESLELLPTESTYFSVSFTPNTEGTHSTTVFITSNDVETPTFQFTIQGTGIGSCLPPLAQASNPVVNAVTGNAAAISFTPTYADGYLVLLTTDGNLEQLPENGSSYSPGVTLGNAVVVQQGGNTSVTLPNLTPNTTYYLFVWAYHNTTCFGGPAYQLTAPLSFQFTTGSSACLADDFNENYGNWLDSGTYLNGNAGIESDGVGFNDATDAISLGTPVENPEMVSFFLARSPSEAYKELTLFYSSDNENWFTLTSISTPEITEAFQLFFVEVALSGTYYLKFAMTERDGGSLYIDNVAVFCSNPSVSPEIVVLGNSEEIMDGTTATSSLNGTHLGTVATNELVSQDFQIQNTGNGVLNINSIVFGNEEAGFQLLGDISDVTVLPGASLVFTVSFQSENAGEFSEMLTIYNNDDDEAAFTFPIAVSVYEPQPTLVVRGVVGSNPTIANGSTNPIATNNTLFAGTLFNTTSVKTFRIANEAGTAPLLISAVTIADATGQFSTNVEIPEAMAVDTFVDFDIVFEPSFAGVQSAVVTIVSNDLDNTPYTFTIQGNGMCAGIQGSIWPLEGPVGTQVHLISDENIANAQAYVNLTALEVVSATEHELVVAISAAAESGNIIVELPSGCAFSHPFTVLNSVVAGCEYESGASVSDLFISQVTDSPSGSLTYVELYNATGNAIDFSISNYRLRFYSNGNETSSYGLWLTEGIAPVNETFVVAIGAPDDALESQCMVPGGAFNDLYADVTNTTLGGINFTENGDDFIGLFNDSGTLIDAFGVYQSAIWADGLGIGDRGADFSRNHQAVVPSPTFSIDDWTVIDWNDDDCENVTYSDIGFYDFSLGTAPIITVHPQFLNQCEASVTLAVEASEAYVGNAALSYAWYVLLPESYSWSLVADGALFSGASTAFLTINDVFSVREQQFYVAVQEGDACAQFSNATTIQIPETHWNGNSWSHGVPNSLSTAHIGGNINASELMDLEICNLIIADGNQITVPQGAVLKVKNKLVNHGLAAAVTIESGGSLLQTNAVDNEGEITIKRNATVQEYDYVYWSAAVSGFLIDSLSPNTPSYAIWDWLPTQQVPDYGTWHQAQGSMIAGKGYAVRVPNISSNTFTATKKGIPVNGNVYTPVSRGNYTGDGYYLPNGGWVDANDDNWNLVGNPYPSALDLNTFFAQNLTIEGVAYLWTHGSGLSLDNENPFYGEYTYNYNAADYLVYNQTGSSVPRVFDGRVASGQGFFVLLKDTAPVNDTILFTNAMRNETFNNDQFFRVAEVDTLAQGKIWLQLSQGTAVVTCLVGYVPGATNAVDSSFDAQVHTSGNALYTLVDAHRLVIQGREVPFQESDYMPLGFTALQPGNYSIGVADVEGIFDTPEQNVYLKDLDMNVLHNLKESPYSFTVNFPGTVNHRFQLQFIDEVLANKHFQKEHKVQVVKVGTIAQVVSPSVLMNGLELFDISGRIVWQSEPLESLQYSLPNQLASGSYVLAVQLMDGQQQFVTFQYE